MVREHEGHWPAVPTEVPGRDGEGHEGSLPGTSAVLFSLLYLFFCSFVVSPSFFYSLPHFYVHLVLFVFIILTQLAHLARILAMSTVI